MKTCTQVKRDWSCCAGAARSAWVFGPESSAVVLSLLPPFDRPKSKPGLCLLKPGRLVIAAYPNFYPVCHYTHDGDGDGPHKRSIPSHEGQDGSTNGGGYVGSTQPKLVVNRS
jgi:hypothetical protein